MKNNTNTKCYALIGDPVNHSFTPLIHSLFGQQTGLIIEYQAITCHQQQLTKKIEQLIHNNYQGVNITLPLKHAALEIASHATVYAKQAQAATVLSFKQDEEIFADNFDGVGLTQDLTRNHNFCFAGKSILIIGAGGATHGILGSLLEQVPLSITVANRTEHKAIALAQQFNSIIPVIATRLSALGNEAFDLIIQATSAGLTSPILQLPTSLVHSNSWCYDLLYAQPAQSFCTWANQAGAEKVLDGLGMLVEQAAASFYLWHGIYPDTAQIMQQLTKQTIP